MLKNLKIFQKPQKLRFQNMKIHENERIEAYQVKKNLINLEECLRKRLDVKERVFWMNKCGQIERDLGNKNWITKSIYIDPQ